MRLWVALLLAFVFCLPADAAEPRVLRTFDFEERDDGNYEETPMHFARVVAPGMPHWVRGRLATDAARSGSHSFRLSLDGGSSLYRLDHGILPAVPGAHYRVEARVRTTELAHARVRVIVRLVDVDGEPVPGTTRASTPFASPGGSTRWSRVAAETSTSNPDAKWLVYELGLLQPEHGGSDVGDEVAGDPMRRFQQDVRGTAWFDDVVVSRIPVLSAGRGASAGVFREGSPVTFWAEATDPAPGDLKGEGVVRDAAGDVVWEGDGTMRITTGDDGLERRHFDFDAGVLPPGWYELDLMVGGAAEVGGNAPASAASAFATMAVVVLAGDDPVPDGRFAADATALPAADWMQVPDALAPLGMGRLEIAVWGGPTNNDAGQSHREIDALAAAAESAGVELTAVFAGPTPELIRAAGGRDWLHLYRGLEGKSSDEIVADLWRASLGYLVSRHAHQVARWQIGRAQDAEDPRLRAMFDQFAGQVRRLVARPELAMPWPARRGTDVLPPAGDGTGGPTAMTVLVPASVPARSVPLYAADAARGSGRPTSVHLELPRPDTYGRLGMLSDVARRITYALAGGADRITLPLPFEPGYGGAGPEPDERYVVLRTLLSGLAGKQYLGQVPAGDVEQGVEAFLFGNPDESGGRGTIVLWARPTPTGGTNATPLLMNLGPAAEQVDLWGNRRRLTQAADGRRDGVAQVFAGTMPTLIVGVDAPLTRLRQTVRLDQPMIESSFRPHHRRLRLTNTFPRSIAGTVRLRPPSGWEARLDSPAFSLGPGESLDRPLELHIPYNSDAGEHRIYAELELRTGGQSDSGDGTGVVRMRVPVTARVGLADVGLRTVARRESGDLVVQQDITNYGGDVINYTAFVLVPGRARQERLVMRLGPGQSTTKLYRFTGAGVVAPGTAVRSGLRELEGTRILNDRVEL